MPLKVICMSIDLTHTKQSDCVSRSDCQILESDSGHQTNCSQTIRWKQDKTP